MLRFLLFCFYAFVGSFGYCFLANIRPRKHMLFFASLGSGLCWGVYLLFNFLHNDILQAFLATTALTIYAEIMARVFKTPATVYLLISLIPLVPGGGIYHTMEHCINGDMMAFLQEGSHTFGIAGALALGILVVTSVMRLFAAAKALRGHHPQKI